MFRYKLQTLLVLLAIGPPLLAGYVHTDALVYLHTDVLIVAAILLGLWFDFRRTETKTRRPAERPPRQVVAATSALIDSKCSSRARRTRDLFYNAVPAALDQSGLFPAIP
jgi:hypothetical protein